jgi:transposase
MPAAYASRVASPPPMQGSLPAGGLRLYREGVEPSGSRRKVSLLHVVLLSRAYPDASWAHGRRKFFELADIASKARNKKPTTISPLALEAVRKIDAIFMVERAIDGLSPDERLAVRRKDIAPLVDELMAWMTRERAKLSRHNEVAKAMEYMFKRIEAFTRFLDDGRICLSNNAAERALRGVALGRRAWLFAGSDRGGERAAVMYTLIQTARLNDVDPRAWLADVLGRINDHAIHRLDELLPWNWAVATERRKVAA